MPRDGSGIYTTPVGTTAVPDTTIESAKYNANVNDVAADLNAPRPIVAGGTGAASAATARTNLKAEVAGQQVTNYDTHVWENGSFWSVGGATNAPDPAHGFAGSCTIYDVGTSSNFIAIEARDVSQTPVGTLYVRMKSGGTWSGWIAQPANPAADYVNVTGDTMSGDLNISKAYAGLILNAPDMASGSYIAGTAAGLTKWQAYFNIGPGGHIIFRRFDDAGVYIDDAFSINRADGIAQFGANRVSHPKGTDWGSGAVRFKYAAPSLVWDLNLNNADRTLWDSSNSPAAGLSNGYQKLASGILLQWGFIGSIGGDITVSLPLTFPTSPLAAIATISGDAAAVNAVIAANVVAITTAQIRIQGRYVLSGGTVGGATQGCHWFAVGY
jgi:hypothetical protein